MRALRLAAGFVFLTTLGSYTSVRANAPLFTKTAYGNRAGYVYTNRIDGTQFTIPVSLLPASFYTKSQLESNYSSNSEWGSAEFRQYWSNPAAWQRTMMSGGGFELGAPTRQAWLWNNAVLQMWAVPPQAMKANHVHTFGFAAPGWQKREWYGAGSKFLYELWVPPGVKMPQFVPSGPPPPPSMGPRPGMARRR
jgi:hypothetical protein